jgi:hypothetical protein
MRVQRIIGSDIGTLKKRMPLPDRDSRRARLSEDPGHAPRKKPGEKAVLKGAKHAADDGLDVVRPEIRHAEDAVQKSGKASCEQRCGPGEIRNKDLTVGSVKYGLPGCKKEHQGAGREETGDETTSEPAVFAKHRQSSLMPGIQTTVPGIFVAIHALLQAVLRTGGAAKYPHGGLFADDLLSPECLKSCLFVR